MSLIKRLELMEKSATPGPWEYRFRGTIGICSLYSGSSHFLVGEMRPENAELTAEMRNALPKLLDLVKTVQDTLTIETPAEVLRALAALERDI